MRFPNINNNEWFPANQTIDLDQAVNIDWPNKFTWQRQQVKLDIFEHRSNAILIQSGILKAYGDFNRFNNKIESAENTNNENNENNSVENGEPE